MTEERQAEKKESLRGKPLYREPEVEAINLKIGDVPENSGQMAPPPVIEGKLPAIKTTSKGAVSARSSQVLDQISITPDPEQSRPPVRPVAPLPGLELPSDAAGLLTGAMALLACVITISFFLNMFDDAVRLQLTDPVITSQFLLCFPVALLLLLLHWLWYCRSLFTLHTVTAKLLPQTARDKQTLVALALLPAAWAGLLIAFVQQHLYLSPCPLVVLLPWLVFGSIVYWFANIFSYPSRLKQLLVEESGSRTATAFPKLLALIPLLPFMFLPYISFWKKSILAIQNERLSIKAKSNAKTVGDSLVIRFRKYVHIERWLRQRYSGGGINEFGPAKALLLFCIGAALVMVTAHLGLSFGGVALGGILGLMPAGPAVSAAGAVSMLPVNQIIIAIFALAIVLALLVGSFKFSTQPTHYEFLAQGFRPFRFRGQKKAYGPLTAWTDLTRISLVCTSEGGQPGPSAIEFVCPDKVTRLPLDSVESVEDRETILQAIEKWAPGVARDASLIQALQPPADHSYTELWLQTLAAPPQRDRLKPLVENAVLCDGRYTVKSALGVGGQGSAYEAVDAYSGEKVVLKEFLLPIYVDVNVRKEVLERFQSESRILKQLDHLQVVKLSDYFVEDHRAYLVLEHIEGMSLRDKIVKEGPLSEQKVRDLARQMCAILTYLHEQEPPVVHRDFTPENLILRSDGVLKLIDFNVAKQLETSATGSVVGKPAYLPPEQFRGQPVTQSDIYGMGATLYFLLTGTDPEPISVSHPKQNDITVSSHLDNIIAQATALNLKDRYQTSAQLLEELDQFVDEGQAEQAKEASSPYRKGEGAESHLTAEGGLMQFRLDEPVTLPVSAPSPQSPALSVAARPRRLGWVGMLVSWATIVLSFFVLAVPDSAGWLDPDWAFHKHLFAARSLAMFGEAAGLDRKLLPELNQCIALKPGCAEAYLLRAKYFERHKLLSKAVDDLKKAVKLEPARNSLVLLGNALVKEGNGCKGPQRLADFTDAVAVCKSGLRATKDPWESLTQMLVGTSESDYAFNRDLARAYLNLGEDELARTSLSKFDNLEQTVKSAPYYYLLFPSFGSQAVLQGMAREQAHEPGLALECLDGFADTGRRYCEISPVTMHVESLQRLRSELMQDHSDQRAISAAWAMCEGLSYNGLGDLDKANSRFSEVIELLPHYTDAYVWRADCLRRAGKTKQAEHELERALKLEPANLFAHFEKGMTYYRDGQYEKSNSEYEIVDKLAGKTVTSMARATNYMALNQPKKAISLYDLALESGDPNERYGLKRFRRGVAKFKIGDVRGWTEDVLGSTYYPNFLASDRIFYFQGLAYQSQGLIHHADDAFRRDKAMQEGLLIMPPWSNDELRYWQ